MAKRATAPAGPASKETVAMALQAAWLGPLGRYVQANELVDVAGAAPADVAAWVNAGVLAPVALETVDDLADEPVVEARPEAAIIMQDKE